VAIAGVTGGLSSMGHFAYHSIKPCTLVPLTAGFQVISSCALERSDGICRCPLWMAFALLHDEPSSCDEISSSSLRHMSFVAGLPQYPPQLSTPFKFSILRPSPHATAEFGTRRAI